MPQPLGNGLINDTYKVCTLSDDTPDYVLQRINNAIFRDVELLQNNVTLVTQHIRQKLAAQGVTDLHRRVLEYVKTKDGKSTYVQGEDGSYWRMMVFIPDAYTYNEVTPDYSYEAGRAFGQFEGMLVDLPAQLGETIPDFHNMELRARQLEEAIQADPKGRVAGVADIIAELKADMEEMCQAECLYREGKLPKRICHCDTKVNNMMFDADGNVLCIIDLDTVMPSFVFSDYGDFLRTAANRVAEDHPEIQEVAFNEDIFRAFTTGFLEGTASFLTPLERQLLPFAVELFPFMQCVRFLTDWINGDTYYKIQYPEHNLVRTRNQLALYRDVRKHHQMMADFVAKG